MATYCILQYLNRQTVLIQREVPMKLEDFPAVTVCSQLHFGSTPSSLWLLNHHKLFLQHLSSITNHMLNLGKYGLILDYLDAAGSEPLFNINNIAMHARVVDEFLHNASDSILVPRCRTMQSKGKCNSSNLVNPRFRNCLQFKLELTDRAVSMETLTILIPILITKNQSEPANGPVTIYLHDKMSLPSWNVPAAQQHLSSHSTLRIGFRVEIVSYMPDGPHRCDPDPAKVKHAGHWIKPDVHTCKRIEARRIIREKCHCDCWWPPLEEWPVQAMSMCGFLGTSPTSLHMTSRLQSLICMQQREEEALNSVGNCTRACRRMRFRTTSHTEPESERGVRRFINLSHMERTLRHLDYCQKCQAAPCSVNCSDFAADVEKVKTYLDRQFSPSALFPNLSLPSPPSQCTKVTCEAVPRVNASDVGESDLRFLLVKVNPNADLVDLYEEKLIHSLWVTFAQSGGACSFFAGLTFTVIAEWVDCFVTSFLNKRDI